MAMIVETPRLGLRTARAGDVAATAALSAGGGSGQTAFEMPMMAPPASSARQSEIHAELAVVRRYDRRLIGWIGASTAESARGLGTLSGWLGDAYRGRGYMTEAAPAALPWLIDRLGLRAVEASMRADDFASQSIVEDLGFQIKARRTVGGIDTIVFAVPCARLRWPSATPEQRLVAVA